MNTINKVYIYMYISTQSVNNEFLKIYLMCNYIFGIVVQSFNRFFTPGYPC